MRTGLFVGFGAWVLTSATPAYGLSINQLTEVTATLDQAVSTATPAHLREVVSPLQSTGLANGRTVTPELSHHKPNATTKPIRRAGAAAVGAQVTGLPLESLEPLSTPRLAGSITTARYVTTAPLATDKRSSGMMPLQASEAGWRIFGLPWYGWLAGGMAAGWGSRQVRRVTGRRSEHIITAE